MSESALQLGTQPGLRAVHSPDLRVCEVSGVCQYLGDQWSIGDWKGLVASGVVREAAVNEPPQNFKEYDPEWARACLEGTIGQSCPHERMLAHVKVPMLFTHHARGVDPATGQLLGAISDLQATKVREIVTAAGQRIEYVSLPDAAHAMHQADPARFAQVLTTWARTLPGGIP